MVDEETLTRSVLRLEEFVLGHVAVNIPNQAALLITETLKSAIFNSTGVAIIATDANGIIQLFNVGAEHMLGYAAHEVVNKTKPSDLQDPQEVIARAEALSVEFATTFTPGSDVLGLRTSRGIEDKYELSYIRKDGSRFPAQVSVTALRDRQTEIIGYLLICTDNSAAQTASVARKEKAAEEMFRLAVESCPRGMMMADGAGKIVMVNGEIERLFGYRRDELIGQPADILVPMRLRTRYVRHGDEFTIRPDTRRIGTCHDLFGVRKDGSEFPLEVGVSSIQVGAGLWVLRVIVDISERKRLEQLKDEFVATVSHELRTPLTSISGALGLLAASAAGKLPDSAARLLSIAYSNTQRLVRLLDDILDIEKMESEQVVFDMKRVEVYPLVEQTIEANRAFAAGYDVRLRLDCTDTAVAVRAAADRLAQVITNLLSNAIKFSPPGAEVVVQIERRPETVRISVRDSGPGIREEFRPRVFDRFAQADSSDARQKGGTGLGLSIVRQIAARLDGAVGFDDAPGGGTIFHFELPSWDHAAGSAIDADAPVDAARILLCLNDPNIAVALRKRLRQIGWATDFAYTAADALVAKSAGYAAILADLEISDGDGIRFIQELREQPRHNTTAIIAVSGTPKRWQDDPRSSKLNVQDWLAKPLDIDQFVQLLDRPRARDEIALPRILHVDDDHDVLNIVGLALGTIADVTSVDSINQARGAIKLKRFNLAILDLVLTSGCGLDLLPDLHDGEGAPIPVIIYSAQDSNLNCNEHIRAALQKSHASVDTLLATVCDRLALPPSWQSERVA
jgi:PAS domain S-box-containing protein